MIGTVLGNNDFLLDAVFFLDFKKGMGKQLIYDMQLPLMNMVIQLTGYKITLN